MLDILLLFIPASLALNLAFGPNNLLALTHGASRGARFALTAALGRLAAFAPMIALSAAGMGVLLAASAAAFTVAKLLGAAYLVYLGIRLWRNDGAHRLEAPNPGSLAEAMRREALVALGNPKAILIFAAFLPQFVRESAYWQDYALFGTVFMICELVAVAFYAGLGRTVARRSGQLLRHLQRLSAITMAGFGIALLFARRPVV